eukprot:Nitzschia sp. Nitz4//scaffold87_size112219//101111//101671//NITZ4_004090-RA/size112219-processed-gene-0.11-mRNA-1//1//CDS//3329559417//7884//frame0
MTTSIVASIVADAAEQAHYDCSELLDKLENENIREEWQLEYLDSHQWETLGAPMGFVAALRKVLEERKEAEDRFSASAANLSVSPTGPGMKKRMVKANPSTLLSLDDMYPEGGLPEDANFAPPTLLHNTSGGSTGLPPVMPTRKVSLGINEEASRQSITMSKPPQGLVNIGEAPPSLPQRLASIDN